MTAEEIEVAYYPCCGCGTAVKTRWTNKGMLSDHNENVLIASWVFHPSCWDLFMRENPPEAT